MKLLLRLQIESRNFRRAIETEPRQVRLFNDLTSASAKIQVAATLEDYLYGMDEL